MAKPKKEVEKVEVSDDLDIEAEIDALENDLDNGNSDTDGDSAVKSDEQSQNADMSSGKASDGDGIPKDDDKEIDLNEEKSSVDGQAKKPVTKKDGGRAIETDCRLCVNYPFNGAAMPVLSLSTDLVKLTDNFTQTFCGEYPFEKSKAMDSRINCKGKKFILLDTVK